MFSGLILPPKPQTLRKPKVRILPPKVGILPPKPQTLRNCVCIYIHTLTIHELHPDSRASFHRQSRLIAFLRFVLRYTLLLDNLLFIILHASTFMRRCLLLLLDKITFIFCAACYYFWTIYYSFFAAMRYLGECLMYITIVILVIGRQVGRTSSNSIMSFLCLGQ